MVTIHRCSNYQTAEVRRAVTAAIANLGGWQAYIKPGETVLLKVNLVLSKGPDAAATTHPAFVAELATASVPMLVLVQNGVGAQILTPIISLLIILGAISTAVNMISGIVTRCVNAIERRMPTQAQREKGHLGRNAVFTLIFTFLAFSIAQFGLMAVVKKGYAYLGYAAMITLFIPFVLHAIQTKGKEI